MPRKIKIELPDGNGPVLTEISAENEAQLQDLVKDTPDLIPTEEFGEEHSYFVVGRETNLPSGSVDLVGLTRGGDVIIIELKTGPQNSDFRRILAQLLDYGSDMGRMSLDVFESTVARRYFTHESCNDTRVKGLRSLREAFGRVWPDLTEPDMEVTFRNLSENLQNGIFEYVIVAQRFSTSMLQTLEYLNESMSGSMFFAVELVKFASQGISAYETRTITKPYAKKNINDKLIKSASETLSEIVDEEYRQAMGNIFDACGGLDIQLAWGTAGTSLRILTEQGKRITVGWWFPPLYSGSSPRWMGLRDLTLGYDPSSVGDHHALKSKLDGYADSVSRVPGAERETRAGLNAFHFDQRDVVESEAEIVELLFGLRRDES